MGKDRRSEPLPQTKLFSKQGDRITELCAVLPVIGASRAINHALVVLYRGDIDDDPVRRERRPGTAPVAKELRALLGGRGCFRAVRQCNSGVGDYERGQKRCEDNKDCRYSFPQHYPPILPAPRPGQSRTIVC